MKLHKKGVKLVVIKYCDKMFNQHATDETLEQATPHILHFIMHFFHILLHIT